MIPLHFEPRAEVGCIEIPNEDFLALITYESYKGPRDYVSLFEKLKKLPGIDDIDYNGHFGAAIHLTKECDATHEQMQAVFVTINEHIAACKAWLTANKVAWT